MQHDEIESLLRKAPQPSAPNGLREEIEAHVPLPRKAAPARRTEGRDQGAWLKRWFPALAYALAMLTCVTMLAVQGNQLGELRRENERLRAATQNLDRLREENAEYQKLAGLAREADRLRQSNLEKPRWQEEAPRLRTQIAEVPALRAENQRLKTERSAAAQASVASEEDPLSEARNKAQSIHCINNLKQIGLAARLWSMDNERVLPTTFQAMSNELNSPKILVCPKDTGKIAATKDGQVWSALTPQNVSYEFLAPGVSETNSPDIIITRCPIHGHVGLLDGSVQNVKARLEAGEVRIVQKDGYYFLTGPSGKHSPHFPSR